MKIQVISIKHPREIIIILSKTYFLVAGGYWMYLPIFVFYQPVSLPSALFLYLYHSVNQISEINLINFKIDFFCLRWHRKFKKKPNICKKNVLELNCAAACCCASSSSPPGVPRFHTPPRIAHFQFQDVMSRTSNLQRTWKKNKKKTPLPQNRHQGQDGHHRGSPESGQQK